MYATGTPTSLADFLNSLATFCATAGWTVDHNGVELGSDYWLAVHKDACYLSYYVPPSNDRVELYGGTGYSGGGGHAGQPNSSVNYSLLYPAPPGPFTGYHFFSSAASGVDYLHTMLEYSANNFLHIHGGALNPVGGASPAIYTAGTQWSALAGGFSSTDAGPGVANFWPFSGEPDSVAFRALQIYATADSVARWFFPGNVSPARAVGAVRSGSRTVNAFFRTPNTLNQLVPFIPLSLYIERLAGGIFSYVGDVYDMRWCSLANNPSKDEITIGSDTWKVFPVISRQPFGSPTASSGNYGFAFRKNA